MKMCDLCFSLFDGAENLEDCPIYRCSGDLVYIDDGLAELIPVINKEMIRNDIMMRTQYTCYGHYDENFDFIVYPYIGFLLRSPLDEGEALSYATLIMSDLMKEPLSNLNEKIRKIKNVMVMTPYTAEFNICPSKYRTGEEGSDYRIFINQLKIDRNNLDSTHKKIRVLSEVQFYFKEFICEIIDKLPSFNNSTNKS